MLSDFVDEFGQHSDPKYRAYSEYFKYYTDRRREYWPKCFAGTAPNTNMSLEHFHSDLNKLAGNLVFNRLDSLIFLLTEKAKNDTVMKLNVIITNPYSFREKDICKRHRDSQTEIPQDNITRDELHPTTWNVRSQSNPDVWHEVQLHLDPCTYRTCLKCRTCNVCRHIVQCTCFAYDRGDLCRHIHAACTKYKADVERVFRSHPHEPSVADIEALRPHLEAESQSEETLLRKELHAAVDGLDVHDLKALHASRKPALASSPRTPQLPANKKIVPQRAMYSGKRKATPTTTGTSITTQAPATPSTSRQPADQAKSSLQVEHLVKRRRITLDD